MHAEKDSFLLQEVSFMTLDAVYEVPLCFVFCSAHKAGSVGHYIKIRGLFPIEPSESGKELVQASTLGLWSSRE